jgi:dihydroxyacetone kinase
MLITIYVATYLFAIQQHRQIVGHFSTVSDHPGARISLRRLANRLLSWAAQKETTLPPKLLEL